MLAVGRSPQVQGHISVLIAQVKDPSAPIFLTVETETPQGIVFFEHKCRVTGTIYRRRVVHDLYECTGTRVLAICAVSQLAVCVVAADPQGTVGLHNAGVLAAAADLNDIGSHPCGCGLDGGAVAYKRHAVRIVPAGEIQLARRVVAPHIQGTVLFHRAHMVTFNAELNHIVQDFFGRPLDVLAAVAVAQLTVQSAAPHPQGPVGFQRPDTIAAKSHHGHVVHDFYGRGLCSGRQSSIRVGSVYISLAAVAYLTPVIFTPHPQGAVRLDFR